MLVRLMYASRAAANLDAEEVSAILRKSRATNAREGITGALCLCNHGHLFIQVLEGGRDAVSRRYNRIAAQPANWVGPGQVSWFQFQIQAPQTPGTYKLYIRPLIEGAQWMEDYGVFWVVTVK